MRLSFNQTCLILADAMLAGPADAVLLVERMAAVLGAHAAWMPELAGAVIEQFGMRWDEVDGATLTPLVAESAEFVAAWRSDTIPAVMRLLRRPPQQRAPVAPLRHLALPQISTLADLAGWLNITGAELAWYANRWRVPAHSSAMPHHHYAYRAVEKRDGRWRLIESPKSELRALQRKILHGLLERIPPHDAAHGFRKSRNIVTFAAPHAARAVVIRLDLADFFASVPTPRVHAILGAVGYPQAVASTLAALCTNRVPSGRLLEADLRDGFDWQTRQRYRTRHLPQGAPTSPVLANLCAYRLDVRLAALARSLDATYTRYADDLAFSGDEALQRAAERFAIRVAAIALEEGFVVQPHKTRIMRRGARQHLAGVVVNRHPNMARDQFDRLKALLTNCVRAGPESQNRDGVADFCAHLRGHVAHATMLNASRGGKLMAIFDRIVWDER
ncbi:MAG: reverse transcriptase family protein [Janthinobacterium lividum]